MADKLVCIFALEFCNAFEFYSVEQFLTNLRAKIQIYIRFTSKLKRFDVKVTESTPTRSFSKYPRFMATNYYVHAEYKLLIFSCRFYAFLREKDAF